MSDVFNAFNLNQQLTGNGVPRGTPELGVLGKILGINLVSTRLLQDVDLLSKNITNGGILGIEGQKGEPLVDKIVASGNGEVIEALRGTAVPSGIEISFGGDHSGPPHHGLAAVSSGSGIEIS